MRKELKHGSLLVQGCCYLQSGIVLWIPLYAFLFSMTSIGSQTMGLGFFVVLIPGKQLLQQEDEELLMGKQKVVLEGVSRWSMSLKCRSFLCKTFLFFTCLQGWLKNNWLLHVDFDIPIDAWLPCSVPLWNSSAPARSALHLTKVNAFHRSCYTITDDFKLWDQTPHSSV